MYPVEICASKRKWWRVVKLVSICPTPCVAEFISMHEGRTKQSHSPRHPRKMKSSQGQLKRLNPSCFWNSWVLRAWWWKCNSIVDGTDLGCRCARHFNCPSNPKTLLFRIYYLPPKAHRRPVNRHMEVKRDGERQIVALWIPSTDSIHFVSSTVFRLFWSSDNCAVNGAKGLQMAAEREKLGNLLPTALVQFR